MIQKGVCDPMCLSKHPFKISKQEAIFFVLAVQLRIILLAIKLTAFLSQRSGIDRQRKKPTMKEIKLHTIKQMCFLHCQQEANAGGNDI